MKTSFIIIFVFLAINTSFISCKKDKAGKENSFTYNDEIHKTTHGYIQSESISANSSVHYVYLCTEALNLVADNGPTGNGDYLMLSFVSNSADKLIAAQYSYPTSLYAYFWLGFSTSSGATDEFGLAAAGTSTATLSLDGDTYEIDYSIAVPSSKTINGYYKGSLEPITGIH